MSEKNRIPLKQLIFSALCISIASVLSNIKVLHLPMGGSVSLFSMLCIVLPGYMYGLRTGMIAAVCHGILQLITDTYILFPLQVIVDYILAFGALGLAGIFSESKNGLLKGYITGVMGRYVFAVISGWLFFGEYAPEGWGALPYSLSYNGIYIFTEAIMTIIVLQIPPLKAGITRLKAYVKAE